MIIPSARPASRHKTIHRGYMSMSIQMTLRPSYSVVPSERDGRFASSPNAAIK